MFALLSSPLAWNCGNGFFCGACTTKREKKQRTKKRMEEARSGNEISNLFQDHTFLARNGLNKRTKELFPSVECCWIVQRFYNQTVPLNNINFVSLQRSKKSTREMCKPSLPSDWALCWIPYIMPEWKNAYVCPRRAKNMNVRLQILEHIVQDNRWILVNFCECIDWCVLNNIYFIPFLQILTNKVW